jgi:methylmalonyl-CoA mutase
MPIITVTIKMKMKEKLFENFPPITNEQWEEEVIKDLKGADFEKTLVWNPIEPISVLPYYRSDILERAICSDTLPGEFPFVRGTNAKKGWEVSEEIEVTDVKHTNKEALYIISKGITSLRLKIRRKLSSEEFDQLLENIDIEKISINFRSGNRDGTYSNLLYNYVEKNGLDPKKIFGSDDFDIYGHLLKHGDFPCGHDNCLCVDNFVEMMSYKMPNFKPISVNATHIQNSGASVVREIGYGLAMGAEYLHNLDRCNISVDNMAKNLQFIFTVGSNYFFEIAKLRAARLLWARIVEAHNPTCIDSTKMYMHCITTFWNKSIYDPHINILRTTTEAMSAILGGTNSLSIRPFDSIYKESDDFSRRIARNIQLILREEAYFDKVIDPGAGSYYIEYLTSEIAEKAWAIFLSVQDDGGFVEAFKKGKIQQNLKDNAIARCNNVALRKEKFVGATYYPDYNENRKEIDTDFGFMFSKEPEKGRLGESLKFLRGPEEIEIIRLSTDKLDKRPIVFNLSIGNLNFRKARAQFATDFFGCAGYEIIQNHGCESIDEGLKKATELKADIIVVCSSDDEYEAIVPEVLSKEKEKIVVVAGNPACRKQLEDAGAKHFIHVKSNIIEELKSFQKLLGITLIK